jgi:RNA polymerase sigma factor (sigma-70 family)
MASPSAQGAGQPSDESLMQAFAGGDGRAFDTLYARHRLWLYNLLLRQLQDRARTDDVFQETWYSLIRAAPGWQPKAKFTTWLYMLARQRLVDAWRRVNPAETQLAFNEEDEALSPQLLQALTDERADPAMLAERAQLVAQLAAHLGLLPAEQREVFLLFEQAELSLDEIALATDSTRETVKSRLRYARAKLVRALSDGWK